MKTPKPKKTDTIQTVTDITDVNFDDFRITKKEIKINNKALPLKIGDRIKFDGPGAVTKTVMGITIHEDNRVQYVVEWMDPNTGMFQSEALTMHELKLIVMNQASKPRAKAGFDNK